jgi:hypothetical protein
MRHLIGIILAIALGVVLFFGLGWGFTHLSGIAANGASLTSMTGLVALSVLAATGLCLGIVIAVRAVSPLAPGLPGLALLAGSVLLAMREHQVLRWIPLQGHSFGAGFRALLVSGVLALLGAAMIVPLFIPARWRTVRADDDDDEEPALTGLLSAPSPVPVPGQADLSEPR